MTGCLFSGHTLKECTGEAKEMQGEFDQFAGNVAMEKDFVFIRLCVLREVMCGGGDDVIVMSLCNAALTSRLSLSV